MNGLLTVDALDLLLLVSASTALQFVGYSWFLDVDTQYYVTDPAFGKIPVDELLSKVISVNDRSQYTVLNLLLGISCVPSEAHRSQPVQPEGCPCTHT